MVIGLVVLPILLFTLISKFGFVDFINMKFPYENISPWTSGLNGEIKIFSPTYPSVLSILFLFGMFLVWGNNYYWLRIASVRSERAAKWSYVLAGVLLFLVFYPLLGLMGAYATSLSPEYAQGVKDASGLGRFFESTKAYGVVLTHLPVWLASLGYRVIVPWFS